jgi:hypothetical protein
MSGLWLPILLAGAQNDPELERGKPPPRPEPGPQERRPVPPPTREDLPFFRDSWGAFTLIFPSDFEGKQTSINGATGATLNFDRDLNVGTDFAFDLNVHFAIERDEGMFLILNFSGMWYSGTQVLPAPVTYGGTTYAAGSSFKTEGHWLWYEFGAGYQVPLLGDTLQLFGGVSLAFQQLTVEQTDEFNSLFTALVGVRGGAILRPFPFLSFGVEAGAWVGGMGWEEEDWWEDRGTRYDASSWSTMVSVWVSLDLHPHVSVRAGYYIRAVATESNEDHHTHSPTGAVIPGLHEDDDLVFRFAGPVIALEIHY